MRLINLSTNEFNFYRYNLKILCFGFYFSFFAINIVTSKMILSDFESVFVIKIILPDLNPVYFQLWRVDQILTSSNNINTRH